MEGAAKHGISCVGVPYGYGSQEELTKAGAGYLAADVEELEQLYCPVFGSRTDRKSHAGSSLPHGTFPMKASLYLLFFLVFKIRRAGDIVILLVQLVIKSF